MDFNIQLVRFVNFAILMGSLGLVILAMVSGPSAFENWYLSLLALGCFGALISAALMSIDKRLKEIESKLEEKW